MDLSMFEVTEAETNGPRRGALRFLAPTNLSWITRAALLPGRSLHLALALKLQWDLAGRQEFAMQSSLRDMFGVDRYAERRALDRLLDAGLIEVSRRRGARPRVRLVGADAPQDAHHDRRKSGT